MKEEVKSIIERLEKRINQLNTQAKEYYLHDELTRGAHREDVANHLEMVKKDLEKVLKLPKESVTDEEIKQKAFDLGYTYRDDEDLKRQDAVQENCEEMGYWMRDKLTNRNQN